MPDEIQVVAAAEKGIAYLETHPGTVTRMGEVAASLWGKTVGLFRGESAVMAEGAALRNASTIAKVGTAESALTKVERLVGDPGALVAKVSAAERLAPAASKGLMSGTGNPFASFGQHTLDFVTDKRVAYGAGLTGLSLTLAGCGKDSKKTAAIPGIPLPTGGLAPIDAPPVAGTPPAPLAGATVRPDGVTVITKDPNQTPERGYPGGIGPDVQDVQNLINKVPGPDGYAAQTAFALFLKNYNSRVNESILPSTLPLVDFPTTKEANRQFVWGKVDHWELKYDSDLYSKAPHGPLGTRDMRPNTDTAPGGGKLPPMFYAVGVDNERKPVDVIEYFNQGHGFQYREQYQFNYQNVDDGSGRVRVSVYNWMDSSMTRGSGPKQVIGTNPNKTNTLEGVTQYYYDKSGKCLEALYFNGWTFNNPNKNEIKPMIDMKFTDTQVTIDERNARSGQMVPGQPLPLSDSVTTRTIRAKAAQMNFYNLLGPKLSDLPNGQ